MSRDRRARGFFTVRFVLGGGNSSGAATAHNDTVVLDIGEGYSSLSLKVLAGFAWALGSAAPSFSHLLKTDDDSFVCVGGVLRWLERLPRRRRDSLYAGSPLAQRCAGKEHLPVLRQLALPRLLRDRKCRRGWRFPLTMHGAGYLLSRGTAVQVVRRAEALHPVPNAEDLTVALLLHYRSRQTNGSADAASGYTAQHRPVFSTPNPGLHRALPVFVQPCALGVLPFASRTGPHAGCSVNGVSSRLQL